MSVLPIGDLTTSTIYQALQGLTARQDAIAQNISNVDTPGYTAENVSFESSLSQAVAAGDPSGMQVTVSPSTAPAAADGNNVNMGDEVVSAQKTELAYQTMVSAMNAKMQLLSTAISGQPSSTGV